MKDWLAESQRQLAAAPGKFQVLIDMRELKPLDEAAQKIMEQGQRLYKKAGMERSCVILDNFTTTMQFKRLAQRSGIYAFERYITAKVTPDWMNKAMDWLTKGVDFDK
jgi:hypothetical protein